VRIPTFSRQSDTADTAEAERPAAVGTAATPVRPRRDGDDTTVTNLPPAPPPASSVTPPPANPPTVGPTSSARVSSARASSAGPRRTEAERAADVDRNDDTADLGQPTADLRPPTSDRRRPSADLRRPAAESVGAEPAVAAGPKPRSSLLATLGLVLGVASALLVLSGPLLGYGIGVAVLALILSLAGVRATAKRHVAGKTDALLGMVLSLAAIVVGVLALTGSLSWLGTDMHPVDSFRQWLDAQFVNRFRG
jgi:hypothetical protein